MWRLLSVHDIRGGAADMVERGHAVRGVLVPAKAGCDREDFTYNDAIVSPNNLLRVVS